MKPWWYPLCILVVSRVLSDLFVQTWYNFRLINCQRFCELKGVVFCHVANPFRGRAEEEKLAKLHPSGAGHRLSLTMTNSTSLRRHSGRYTNAICLESHWRFGCSCHESWIWVLQDSETTLYSTCILVRLFERSHSLKCVAVVFLRTCHSTCAAEEEDLASQSLFASLAPITRVAS